MVRERITDGYCGMSAAEGVLREEFGLEPDYIFCLLD